VCSSDLVLRARTRGTRVIDLKDAVLTPGLVDCHTHFFYWALQRSLVIDVSHAHSLEAALAILRREAPRKRMGDWVIGVGFDHNRWGNEFPTANDLDRAIPDVPAIVRSRDVHSAWLNSVALRRLGLNRGTADPPGGRYLRDARGELTGVAQDVAMELLPNPERELAQRTDAAAARLIERALLSAQEATWALGVTGVHAMDDGPSLTHLLRLRAAERLGLRVLHAVQLADFERASHVGLRSGFGDEWLRVGGIKIFADGALGSQTALMFTPYPGRPGFCGVPVIAGEELSATVARVADHGWSVCVHAIGDRAVHEAVTAIAAAGPARGGVLPHRIEHAQCVRPVDVRRMARAGIVASVQPCHVLGDINTAEKHWPRAQRHAYPLRQLWAAGVTLAGGSDVPVESIDPRRSLFGAVVRTDEGGYPEGGWFPDQKLTIEEALRIFTQGAAVAAGKPAESATVSVGAVADLTVWADDPVEVSSEALLKVGIRGCVVGGQVHIAGC
jgi:predicted amidohydrolase YtcJ